MDGWMEGWAGVVPRDGRRWIGDGERWRGACILISYSEALLSSFVDWSY